MLKNRRIILASSSSARKELLQQLKIPFETISPDIDESPLADEMPVALAQRLSIAKAKAVAERFPDALIIASDQVGVVDKQLYGKPHTNEQAILHLQQLSGKTIQFFIGLCLLDTNTDAYQVALATFAVTFRILSQAMIENYLQKESALHCAGSVRVDGLGISLLEKMQGDDYTALIGLPMIKLVTLLTNAGITVP
jgi:septum formation protein